MGLLDEGGMQVSGRAGVISDSTSLDSRVSVFPLSTFHPSSVQYHPLSNSSFPSSPHSIVNSQSSSFECDCALRDAAQDTHHPPAVRLARARPSV